MSATLIIIARLLLGGAFIVFGIRNIKNIPRLAGVIAERGVPMPKVAAWIGVILQLLAGVLTFYGPFGVIGGICGIVFVYVAVYLFHQFWSFEGAERVPHFNAWVMNTALAGGFLMVIATSL